MKGIRTIESCTRRGTGDWNEDGLILHPPAHRYGVVDGATGFDPVRDPLGRTPGRIAMETVVSTSLGEKDSASLRFLTLEANRRLRTLMQSYGVDVSDPSRRWSAAHAVVQIRGDHLEWVQSGDCKIYAASRDGEVLSLAEDRVKPLDDLVLSRWVEEFEGSRPDGVLPEPIREDLRKNRARANRPGGYPVINGDPALEKHLQSGTLSLKGLSFLLLVTDGMVPRHRDEAEWVRRIGQEGLATMMDELLREERRDPTCARMPRFKVSDDKAGILIRFE
ncbi:hypothetical protein SAMN04488025_12118 [Planifilum fulgidum]|uniref:Protein phosphatase 2C n=1 Tax=Planifilum fulgidum TaxID=201973 RepID=A0A1I2Q063_9BACL|nr:hypothetical protein [Planifilum fulgidum]SFG21668.1 hypothetical protein SAMN04488025_12118 [Planifilum fulgidum]